MKDLQGRAYATVAGTKAGDTLEADDGFTCIRKGARLVVAENGGLYVPCRQGEHHLDGQISTDDGEAHYVGFYPAS